jgi:hypothetical protein
MPPMPMGFLPFNFGQVPNTDDTVLDELSVDELQELEGHERNNVRTSLSTFVRAVLSHRMNRC